MVVVQRQLIPPPADWHLARRQDDQQKDLKVPPRFELGSLDSESRVLTITPWDPCK
ncbi:hypothetical protein J6590_102385 [Homalodisca vitripennis]|nr:hypothetical protein J6590_102385 [Homalodisca vitripennis]